MTRSEKHLNVFLTCDGDPDRATSATPERDTVTWEGFEMLPRLVDYLGERSMPFTFFVRSDRQMRSVMGSFLGMFERHEKLLNTVRATGNEIGWHPHLYDKVDGAVVPAVSEASACAQMTEVHQSLTKAGLEFQSLRLGEAWHSSATMRLANEMGFRFDSTAIPGRARADGARVFDWEPTPNHAYHPSISDYRIADPQNSLAITEVPMTSGWIKTNYDAKPMRRYLNLTYRPDLFAQGLNSYLEVASGFPRRELVFIFHPGELLEIPANDLHTFGWGNFRENLEQVTEHLEQAEYRPRYLTLNQANDFSGAK